MHLHDEVPGLDQRIARGDALRLLERICFDDGAAAQTILLPHGANQHKFPRFRLGTDVRKMFRCPLRGLRWLVLRETRSPLGIITATMVMMNHWL